MDKQYDHKINEDKIYDAWEKSYLFSAPSKEEAEEKGMKPFTIIMPPPNANDPLHVGHAMFVTLEDILIRYHRMKGEASLWLPGTDHAGIETQFVFEKKLSKKGKSRFDYDRETLYQMIWDYVQENGQVAIEQMKKLGASADWDRYKFTLDEDIVSQVKDTFKKLHNDGLVYRAERLVNYCTRCGTSYSELEVNYEDRVSPLYYVKYKLVGEDDYVVVATTRPEPIFADTHLAVNPEDKKRKGLIGRKVLNPLTEKEMEIIGDSFVDPEFGTGVVKLTPAHDQHDFEVAEKHNLPLIRAIDEQGRMTDNGGKYAGMKVIPAREAVVEDLKEKGLIEKIDDKYENRVGTCYRCGRVIEPMPKLQWFIKVEPLTKRVIKALDEGEVIIHGAGREKILRHWLSNLRDWNISRQIVWGIRMPVWYKEGSEDEFVVSDESPGMGYFQESDTFDTWFSSGQWPVVTLRSTMEGDFDYYYPTSVMETGYDILPFWVMRMLMLGLYMTDQVPFRDVYLHGLVRDEKGLKMSKSKGNVINPLDMVDKYGADAIRMALVMSSTPGTDKNVGESTIRGMRNFANKIWNASRFIMMQEGADGVKMVAEGDSEFSKRVEEIKNEIDRLLSELRIGQAAEMGYNEFWHWFCDECIERAKNGEIGYEALKGGLFEFLKILHPFVPFVTESVWKQVGGDGLLMGSSW